MLLLALPADSRASGTGVIFVHRATPRSGD